jgi:hypothetical protein
MFVQMRPHASKVLGELGIGVHAQLITHQGSGCKCYLFTMPNLSRVFNLRENVRLEFQAMFFNIFNRTFLNNPTSTNAKATPVYSNGTLISGFGAISTASTNQLPRTGLLSLRLQF